MTENSPEIVTSVYGAWTGRRRKADVGVKANCLADIPAGLPRRSTGSERKKIMYLTKNEIEIMDVLWREQRPLARGEILKLSDDKTWMDSSVHILLNSMLKKGAIREAGFIKCGKTCGRVYEAALTCEEYYVSTFDSTRQKPDLTKLLSAYIEKNGMDAETAAELTMVLEQAK